MSTMRRQQIVESYKNTKNMSETARMFGISRERIRQIVNKDFGKRVCISCGKKYEPNNQLRCDMCLSLRFVCPICGDTKKVGSKTCGKHKENKRRIHSNCVDCGSIKTKREMISPRCRSCHIKKLHKDGAYLNYHQSMVGQPFHGAIKY